MCCTDDFDFAPHRMASRYIYGILHGTVSYPILDIARKNKKNLNKIKKMYADDDQEVVRRYRWYVQPAEIIEMRKKYDTLHV